MILYPVLQLEELNIFFPLKEEGVNGREEDDEDEIANFTWRCVAKRGQNFLEPIQLIS